MPDTFIENLVISDALRAIRDAMRAQSDVLLAPASDAPLYRERQAAALRKARALTIEARPMGEKSRAYRVARQACDIILELGALGYEMASIHPMQDIAKFRADMRDALGRSA